MRRSKFVQVLADWISLVAEGDVVGRPSTIYSADLKSRKLVADEIAKMPQVLHITNPPIHRNHSAFNSRLIVNRAEIECV